MRLVVFHTTVRPDGELVGLLDREARLRARAISNRERREAHVTGQALLRAVVAPLVGVPPDRVVVDRVCVRCGGGHGKPVAVGADVDLSLAHADGTVLLAVSANAGVLVGLDAEPRRRVPAPRPDVDGDEVLAREVLDPAEQREWWGLPTAQRAPGLVRWWTRKEAVLKALGHGLAVPPRALRVTPPGQPPRVLAWDRELAGADLSGPVALADVDLPTVCGTVVALGVEDVQPELADADHLLSAASLTRWG